MACYELPSISVGSAIEHAAELDLMGSDLPANRGRECRPCAVKFRDLFALGEAGEDQASSLSDVLSILAGQEWGKDEKGFSGSDVSGWMETFTKEALEFRSALEASGGGKQLKVISAKAVTWRLKAIKGAPANVGDGRTARTLILNFTPNHEGGTFRVRTLK